MSIDKNHLTDALLDAVLETELQEAVETYKVKVESYIKRLEEAEIAKAKIARAESICTFGHGLCSDYQLMCSQARRALADAEKAHADIVAERNAAEERLKTAEERVRDLEARLDEEGRESSDLQLLRQRLAEEMEDERKNHQEELSERDFTADQTRKKYQGILFHYLLLKIQYAHASGIQRNSHN